MIGISESSLSEKKTQQNTGLVGSVCYHHLFVLCPLYYYFLRAQGGVESGAGWRRRAKFLVTVPGTGKRHLCVQVQYTARRDEPKDVDSRSGTVVVLSAVTCCLHVILLGDKDALASSAIE